MPPSPCSHATFKICAGFQLCSGLRTAGSTTWAGPTCLRLGICSVMGRTISSRLLLPFPSGPNILLEFLPLLILLNL
ncbi:unnamed protein product [Fusarium graminearum]|uniref:Chromosome 3, complete genome n=1 Tax=Gibberella zeae (strain ATCC MYA-4620 / CBS 123657 / FGSC 9075 / NRRL 31084 / PH-1) TaxID=229533 RepID=A0A098DY21_GIBZE|nr:unnamed protein product [Fusarium graminearum]